MNNSWDSYAHYKQNINWKEIFIKEYKEKYISKHIVELYHILQNFLSNYKKTAYFGNVTIDNTEIIDREIEILDLNPEATFKANNLQKEEILITQAKYIEGKTLKDYEDEIGKKRINIICQNITKDLERKTSIVFTDMYWVTSNNIKINIKWNTAKLIVTDISCNIKNLYHTEKNALLLNEMKKQ